MSCEAANMAHELIDEDLRYVLHRRTDNVRLKTKEFAGRFVIT